MDRNRIGVALLPALVLVACGQGQSPGDAENAAPAAPAAIETNAGEGEAVLPEPAPTAANMAEEAPDLTPPVLTPEAERGVQGARNVLLSFARAIELKQFAQARSLLSAADQRKWSRAEFAAIFADLGKITVSIPDGTMEGAAGSSYYSAPVSVTANDKDGRPVRIEGKAVLRRVNDIDGATPAQTRWHFETLTLEWTH